ncbi:MAG: BON domain-containing protein [Arenicellales bacterium]|nr:BON domain-containing protein [Arenicellales bacterium]
MNYPSNMRQHIGGIALMGLSVILISGCVSVPIAGLIGGSAIAIDLSRDNRSVGTYLNDNVLEAKISNEIRSDAALSSSQINVSPTIINGVILLTGEAPNRTHIDRILDIAKSFKNTRKVINRIELAGKSTLASRANDSWITMEVKTALFHSKKVDHLRIKVVTERAHVYLMGLVSAEEADAAAQTARSINGVARVVKVFEYL